MKKLFFIIALVSSVVVHAQLIDKGSIVIQAGAGLGIYHYKFTELSTGIAGERDTSGAFVFPMQVEYGVQKWLGVGFNFTFHNFIEGDSLNDERAVVLDFGIAANIHVPWNLKKFDLTGNIGYGFSRFKYEYFGPTDPIMTANGSVFFMGINPRLYFSDNQRMGIHAWYRFSKYLYPEGTLTNNSGYEVKYKLDSPSNAFGLGLFYKI